MKVTKSDPDKRYLFECKDSTSESGHSLLVTCEATHAGINNGNARWYRPDKQQASAHTWLPKGRPGRPVLLRHDKDGDPQGRVKKARYVDLSYQYFGDLPGVKSLAFYDSKKTGKMNIYDSVDWVMRNLQPRSDYKGLGYIELGLDITDPTAIGKVQRDEYATVSVGFRTNQAVCSICHTDWAVDDKCEHASELGGKVDGKPVFLISGDFEYDEVSFVNFPADPWGIVTNKETMANVADSLRNRIFFLGMPESDRQRILQHSDGVLMVDSVNVTGSDIRLAEAPDEEETNMDLKALQAEIVGDSLTKERAFEIRTILEDNLSETGAKRSLSTLNAKVRSNKWNDGVKVLNKETVEARIVAFPETLAGLSEVDKQSAIETMNRDAETFGIEFTAPGVSLTTDGAAASDVTKHTPAELKTASSVLESSIDSDVLRIVALEFTDEEEKAKSGKAAAEMLDSVHKFYHDMTGNNQSFFRYAVGALIEHWATGSTVDYYKERLMKGDDSTLVPREDFDTLQSGFETAEAELKVSNDSVAALLSTNQTLLKDQKSNMARLLVYGSILTGDSAFKNLSAEKLAEEIMLREKRTLVSLTDSVSDLMRKIPSLDLTQVSKPSEGVKEVKDSAQLSQEDGPTETAPPSEAKPPRISRWTDEATALRMLTQKKSK